jgi:penicillin-binding protein 1C
LLPSQIVADIPTRIGGYIPENHTGVYLGAVRADRALAESLNVPAARLLQEYGVSRFYALLKDLGMNHLFRPADDYGIPLILGGAESTLFELTGIYASLGRIALSPEGSPVVRPPHVLAGAVPPGEPAPFSAASSYLALEAMREVQRPASTIGWQFFANSSAVSWKTGTSYGLRDAWAIGLTEEYAVGVWVGNASGRGAPRLRGSATAGPMLFRIFELLGPSTEFRNPGGMQLVELCADSGMAAGPDCADRLTGYIPRGVHDPQVCPYCRTLHLDSTGTYQVTTAVYPLDQMVHSRWFELPGTMAYYASRRLLDYEPPPPLHPDLRDQTNSVTLAFPLAGSQVYIPVEMDGQRGSVVARAHHPDRTVRLFWHIDGRYLGETERTHTFELSPPPGVHTLTVLSETGEQVAIEFEVLSGE